MTRVASGEFPLGDEEQELLLGATAAASRSIAESNPEKLVRLQSELELVKLDSLIAQFRLALDAGHSEAWWQEFFEQNIYALQLVFGGPTVFVDAQVSIGEGGKSVKGQKIADYLFRSTPSTRLLKSTPYRSGVYGVKSEISEAVTQVLDQALQLTRSESSTKTRMADSSWVSNAPRCFVVAGKIAQFDSDVKLKSFDLYREHLAGVRLVTYDEILEQLISLRSFLGAPAAQ